ncbi:MAG: RdgB/HAM1 family non-canonical purine NTP pyrophosphatase [Geovibrio sp.]|nr:RdgB/HAM1 family non-canonical purine NTP pyrophosphatase [Geovibrio sp.]
MRSAYEFTENDFDVEETGSTFEENAAIKADALSALIDGYVIADDSGLCVDALGGNPGIYSARYAGVKASDAENNALLLKNTENTADEDRTARFVCAVALSKNGITEKIFRGECEGMLGRAEKGANGFGYDPLLVMPDGRSLAEYSPEEKNRISHRFRALELLRKYLAEK